MRGGCLRTRTEQVRKAARPGHDGNDGAMGWAWVVVLNGIVGELSLT